MPKRAPGGKLVIVANRLPVTRAGGGSTARWASSSGGLVTALAPILRSTRGEWVGWNGSPGRAGRPFLHDGIKLRPVPLTDREVEDFYHHFSNRTLWPLYHDAIRTPEFNHDWWQPYVDANERFAKYAAAAARTGDVVWVHDYHLQLVPDMLRRLRPDVRIGFFLHIPFPPEELFAWLPWRRQLLRGLMGADVVGFQTYANAQNFSRAARHLADADGTDVRLGFEGRTIHVGTFPISIDFDEFATAAASESVVKQAQHIRRSIGPGRKVVLCVDRLDYTKGIDVRLQAYELMLTRATFGVRDCVLVQVAVPSRERVAEYADMRTRIEQIVGRINGEFSEPGRVAVHYFRRSLSREELLAYYRAADVMLVTPLRDGMNLVAKEYVAARADGGGVLVLSEFAGAARELRRAILVNPRDVEGMCDALSRAMVMPAAQARQRMAILRMVVRRHDVHEWAGSFLAALDESASN